MTSGTFPGGQRGSLAKIHDMKNEAPITKVHTQVSFFSQHPVFRTKIPDLAFSSYASQ